MVQQLENVHRTLRIYAKSLRGKVKRGIVPGGKVEFQLFYVKILYPGVRKLQVCSKGLVQQGGVQRQAGDIDIVVNGIVKAQVQVDFCGGGVDIDTFSFRVKIAAQFHAVGIFHKRTDVHFPDIHQHIVQFVVYVVEAFKRSSVAAKIHIAGKVCAHSLQIQGGGGQVGLGSKRV